MRENISNPKNYTKLYMLYEYCTQHFEIIILIIRKYIYR